MKGYNFDICLITYKSLPVKPKRISSRGKRGAGREGATRPKTAVPIAKRGVKKNAKTESRKLTSTRAEGPYAAESVGLVKNATARFVWKGSNAMAASEN